MTAARVGVGKPMGIFNPRSGIPVCETAAATAAGSLTWQDLYMLKWEIPAECQAAASYLLNQRTWAQIMTMSDASGRPLWSQAPGGEPGVMLAGSPVHIVTQMPDIAAGSILVAFGREKTYTIVWRKAVTLQVDPYSANSCALFKVEARVGGGTTCPAAARLLRIRSDTATKLCILIEGALAAGAREAKQIFDEERRPATLTHAGRVALVRVLDETRRGHDRIDCHLLNSDEDGDGEVRLASKDAVFTLQERGAEPPELEAHNLDVKAWLGPVLLALATKIVPGGDAAPPN